MSSKRKSIGLPAQVRPVPPVPHDYGIGGSPSPVVGSPQSTNQRETNKISSDPNYDHCLPLSECQQPLVLTTYPGKQYSIPEESDPSPYLSLPVSLTEGSSLQSFTSACTSAYSADCNFLSVELPKDCPFPNHIPPSLQGNPRVFVFKDGDDSSFFPTITHFESHPTGCLTGSGDQPWRPSTLQDSPASSYPPMVT